MENNLLTHTKHETTQFNVLSDKGQTIKVSFLPFAGKINCKNANKSAQKSSKTLKPSMNNVVSTGMKFAKALHSVCHMRCVRFARYCGQMYRRHLFSYAGRIRIIRAIAYKI